MNGIKCRFCGKKNREDAVVCKNCGAALPCLPVLPQDWDENTGSESISYGDSTIFGKGSFKGDVLESEDIEGEAREVSENKISKKTLAILVTCGVGVVAVIVLLLAVFSSSGITLPIKKGYAILENEYGTVVSYNGEAVVMPNTTDIVMADVCLDHSEAGLLTQDGCLYLLSDGETKEVALDARHFALADKGRMVVYEDDEGRLWRYDGKGNRGKKTIITEDEVDSGFVISPDGKSVLYNKIGDDRLYLCVNKRSYELCRGMIPLAVSNGGKCIFAYMENEKAIYTVDKKGRSTQLRAEVGAVMWLNDDHTELVFSVYNSTGAKQTLISIDGDEPTVISNRGVLVPVLTASTQLKYESDELCAYTAPFNTFNDKIFYGDSLVQFDRENGSNEFGDAASYAVANDSYTELYFLSDAGELYVSSVKSLSDSKSIAGDSYVIDVKISANGKTAWYISDEGTLYRFNGDKVRIVAQNILQYGVLRDGKVFAIIGDKLVYSSNGRKVKSFDIDADSLIVVGKSVFYFNNGAWYSVDKKGNSTAIGG